MPKKTARRNRLREMVRASVSVPADHYAALERIADKKRVSLAWVVRESVERYVAAEDPRGDEEPQKWTAPPKTPAPKS